MQIFEEPSIANRKTRTAAIEVAAIAALTIINRFAIENPLRFDSARLKAGIV